MCLLDGVSGRFIGLVFRSAPSNKWCKMGCFQAGDAEMSQPFRVDLNDSVTVYPEKPGTSSLVAGQPKWCSAHCVNSAIARLEVIFVTVNLV